MIYILLGKSAAGKDTLLRLMQQTGQFKPIVSTTSRPIRENEIPDVDYHFVSKQEFLNMIDNHKLIEYRKYDTLVGGNPDTWYYGTSRDAVNTKGKENYVAVLDPSGAKTFKEKLGEDACTTIYLTASKKIRTERARKRGSFDETEWNRRLEDDEIRFRDMEYQADIVIDNNTSIDDSTLLEKAMKEIIRPVFYLLIAGSRNYNDYSEFCSVTDYILEDARKNGYRIVIVSGGAKGADTLARKYARENHLKLMEFPADWDGFGKQAGYIRNKEMHRYIYRHKNRGCLCFWSLKEYSKGTRHNFQLAFEKRTPLAVYDFIEKRFLTDEEKWNNR